MQNNYEYTDFKILQIFAISLIHVARGHNWMSFFSFLIYMILYYIFLYDLHVGGQITVLITT